MELTLGVRGRAGARPLQGWLIATMIAALVVVSRLPFRSHYLLNWDADQFALGLQRLDVVHHQPHPPGYLGYLLLGRAFQVGWPDPNGALVSISIAGEAAGVVVAYLFATSLFGRAAGLITALAMTCSPLFWYYGEAANTYALEPMLVLGVAWASWQARREGSPVAVTLAGLSLGVAGAIRPSTAVLLAPLVTWSLVRRGGLGPAFAGLALAGASTLAWLLPLVWISGGPARYWMSLTQLGASVTSGTAIWRAGPAGLATTTAAVLLGTVWELGAFVIISAFGLTAARRLGGACRWPEGWPEFVALWTLPAVAVYLLIHIGEVVYVQVFTPALFLMLGPALEATLRSLGRIQLRPLLLSAGLVANVATFLFPAQDSLAGQVVVHDRWVSDVVSTVSAYDPRTTVLVTDSLAAGAYRTAQVYLPEYHRVAVGRDRLGHAGRIYGDVYEPWRSDRSQPLWAAPGTTTFVFLDDGAYRLVGNPSLFERVRLAGGGSIHVWRGPAPVGISGHIYLRPDCGLSCSRPRPFG